MERKEYWYWLYNLKRIGIRKINALLTCFGNPEVIFYASRKQLMQCNVLTESDLDQLLNYRDIPEIKERYRQLVEKGIQFITREDENYPTPLNNIFDAPVCFYVRGRLPEPHRPTIAIVGARNCSEYGREMAYRFARELSTAGVQIISGLALGIDGYAHKGALEGKTPTFGIMGCGIDLCYPASNIELYMQLIQSGGILSEYGIGMPAKQGNFPMRNRIISGLSDGVLVVEAKDKSGSLITADMALEQGKDVFAIPGRICDQLSRGCNNLIKMGAEMVNKPEDILEYYHIIYKNTVVNQTNSMRLQPEEKLVLESLDIIPKHMNQICERTGLSLLKVMEILSVLERQKLIKQTIKNYYSTVI